MFAGSLTRLMELPSQTASPEKNWSSFLQLYVQSHAAVISETDLHKQMQEGRTVVSVDRHD